MYTNKPKKSPIAAIIILSLAILCGGFFYVTKLNAEIELYASSKAQSIEAYRERTPSPFINNAAYTPADSPTAAREDALYYYVAPEGFTIISHSAHWDKEMLELLYQELKQNTHGDEIEKLYEIVVYPHENEELLALATYAPGIATASFRLSFPAFPKDFSVDFPFFTGRINIYGGDTKTTIESIAGSLSHEYGHHYTFYYMFDHETRRQDLLGQSQYAKLREADTHGLITSVEVGEDYFLNRHRYIIETAAEDYVTLMGSQATRQVEDYFDIKQILEDSELIESRRSERNAFPQENMSIPLAIDVEGLAEHFYSFISSEPREPTEEKQDMILHISRQSEQHRLETGLKTYTHYIITWNTPYKDAIYTVAFFDPYNYLGWGVPIKTVRPEGRGRNTSEASAIIGEYAQLRGNVVHSAADGIAEGIKTFYVVAQLPDGTYYLSELYEFNFG